MGSGYVLFGLVGQALDDFLGVFPRPAFLGPTWRSESDAFRVQFVLECTSVFGEFGVCVLLDGVALRAFRLESDADVTGHPSAV